MRDPHTFVLAAGRSRSSAPRCRPPTDAVTEARAHSDTTPPAGNRTVVRRSEEHTARVRHRARAGEQARRRSSDDPLSRTRRQAVSEQQAPPGEPGGGRLARSPNTPHDRRRHPPRRRSRRDRPQLVTGVVGSPVEDGGVDRTRDNGAHLDRAGSTRLAQSDGEATDGELRHAVGRHERVRDQAQQRRQVDQRPVTLPIEDAQGGAATAASCRARWWPRSARDQRPGRRSGRPRRAPRRC